MFTFYAIILLFVNKVIILIGEDLIYPYREYGGIDDGKLLMLQWSLLAMPFLLKY